MSQTQKVLVIKREDRATLPREAVDRQFLIDMRRALLQQLAVIEKRLGFERRCQNCGYDLSR